MSLILVINPGSMSTKLAAYWDKEQLWLENIHHSAEDLAKYHTINHQMPMRRRLIDKALEQYGHAHGDFDAIAARGGLLCSLEAGAYRINEEMVTMLRDFPKDPHASNLAAQLAHSIACEAGVDAYIYDGVTVDEMLPLMRVTGLRDIQRQGKCHNLNMRAAAIRYAKDAGKPLDSTNIIVCHLGSGISVSIISGGKIIDMISDDEGPFSPERAGSLSNSQLIEVMVFQGLSQDQMMKKLKRNGGLMAHLGTSDPREVERMISEGDAQAALIYEAMALNVAKSIAQMAVSVSGRVDAIVLTGGIANSKLFTGWIKERVNFIASVSIIPGENEMQSLAEGVLRVLTGQEAAHEFLLPKKAVKAL